MSNTTATLSALNIFTLVIVAAVLLAALLLFLRKKGNRHPMENQREENIAQRLDAGKTPTDPM